jgi:flavorubredoxin
MKVTTGELKSAVAEELAQTEMLALIRKLGDGTLDMGVPDTFPLEIAPNIFWLGTCSKKQTPAGELHTGVWAYIIVGPDATFLFETGHPQGWEIVDAQIRQCLDGRSLTYVMPTHPEIPHAGNLSGVLDGYPEAVALVDHRDYHLHFPEHSDRLRVCNVGDEFDLGGGYVFRVVNAVLRDMPNTFWGYEVSNRVLFVGDGFSYLHSPDAEPEELGTHLPGQCGRASGVGEPFPSLDDFVYFASNAFYWSRYRSNADVMFDELNRVLAECPADILAPTHGNVAHDVKRVVPLARAAYRKAYRG